MWIEKISQKKSIFESIFDSVIDGSKKAFSFLKNFVSETVSVLKDTKNSLSSFFKEIVGWKKAIKQKREVWEVNWNYWNTPAVRNNNPWNLREKWDLWKSWDKWWGFWVFSTPQLGREALNNYIDRAKSWKSRYYRPDNTLTEYFTPYAWEADAPQYAKNVSKRLWISIDTEIKDIDTEKLATAIARQEDQNMYRKLKDMNIVSDKVFVA